MKIINEEREGEKNKDEEGRREEKNCCEKRQTMETINERDRYTAGSCNNNQGCIVIK